MRTSSTSDFTRWLDQKVLGFQRSPQTAETGSESSPGVVHAAPVRNAEPRVHAGQVGPAGQVGHAGDAGDAASFAALEARGTGVRAAVPVCLQAIGPAGYMHGFRERRTLQAAFQIVRVEGLQTLDKGPCTVTFHRAVEDSFDGRSALRVRVFTHSFGGRMGCVGEFSEVRQLYFDPRGYALLGWDLGEQRVRCNPSITQHKSWVAGRSYPLGSRTAYHRNGHPIESFVERGEVSLHPQQRCSLALRSYAVDDASEQSSVLELFEFSVEAGKLPQQTVFRTQSHNICAVRENLTHGSVLQMTMIRCN